MTAQFSDRFRLHGHTYDVSAFSAGPLSIPPRPGEAGQQQQPCWRGYVATFGMQGGRLVLEALDVSLGGPRNHIWRRAPAIHGMAAKGPRGEEDRFNVHYDDVDQPLGHRGGVLLADGFIRDLYVHMGFHPPWKYERVVELVFEDGVLETERDRSAEMAEFRRRFPVTRIPVVGPVLRVAREEIDRFTEATFGRTYRL